MVEALTAAHAPLPTDDAATTRLLKKSKLNPRDCQGSSACLIKLAAAISPSAVLLGVDVGRIGGSLAIHVEAVNATSSLGSIDVSASANVGPLQELDAFAVSLVEKLSPHTAEIPATPPPAIVTDTPRATSLEPVSTPKPELIATRTTGPSTGRKVLPWVVAGGAVASLAVAGTFLGLGATDKSKYDASVTGAVSRLPGSELQALSNQANSRFSIGLTTAVIGAALALGSVVLFATE